MREPCPECGAYDGWHCWGCDSIPEAEKAAHFERYARTFLNGQERYKAALQARNGFLTALQGKCAVLTHENNTLRAKLRRLEKRDG